MHDTYTKRHRFCAAPKATDLQISTSPFTFFFSYFTLSSFHHTSSIKTPLSFSHLKHPKSKREKKSTMTTSFSTAAPFLLVLLLSISSTVVYGASHHHAAAPAPSVDCSTLILNMADCLSFVSSGGTEAKPSRLCCDGLKTVLKTDAECICEAFKSSASLGVTLNLTKASTLPAACKLHAPSIANCGASVAPTTAPGLAPGVAAPGPDAGGSLAPNQSPGNDGSSLIPISFTTVFSAIFFTLFLSRV
ncbi:unnamed protein product [Thlaspi arvense]|uniref:Bifunctional inhibitor/plant lipid transfer protein/seed storage helical domain-containing protein n=1 Tax=Thlaspi arvense TaxID=13288 RepID=A0AAU9RND2_THLAR|nr:unnamed protein product [Thlaspi arvense]